MKGSSGDESLLTKSRLFDGDWYAEQFQDVEMSGMGGAYHYLHYGHILGRNPSPLFDADRYLEHNEDVARSGANPLLHYLKYGLAEGRAAYPFRLPEGCEPRDPHALLASPYLFEPSELPAEFAAALKERGQGVRVSVVMPTWNRRAVIGRALRSAFRQSLLPHEVIVADDGSVDGTLAMLKVEFAREIEQGRLILLPGSRGGVSHARNRALERATGDVVAYLDSDNEWHPDHLLYAVGALAHRGDARCAYTAIRINRAGVDKRLILSRRYDRARLLRANYIDLNAFVHRRDLFVDLGGFDRSLRRLVDWDLIIRYTADASPIHVPVVTVEYYLDADSLGNITYTEKVELARDTIFVKHRAEYVAKKILTDEQIDRANARLLAAVAADQSECAIDAFNVVLSDETWLPRLPDLSALDTGVTVWLKDGASYRVLSSSLPGVMPGARRDALPVGAYWCPDLSQPVPGVEQLRALYLAIATEDLDLVVVSYGQETGDGIRAACLRNQVVVTDQLVEDWLEPQREMRLGERQGKVLRIPPAPDHRLFNVDVTTFLGPDAVWSSGDSILRERTGEARESQRRQRWPAPVHTKRKPIILVLPMKVAVGGVERNTVEIMRALRDQYDFIYLTMERVQQAQGSLADQVIEVAHRFIDMAEASKHARYVDFLRMLKSSYAPDLVWICNGSMWMCKNAHHVRDVFHDVPIVDQQVYDVHEGWIRRYMEPGIQSFDRFIAINSRIRDRFLSEFKMDPARVDLIYSAIDSNRFREQRHKLESPDAVRKKYGLPDGKRLFAFMGRLVEQKRPLDFLEIAARRSRQHDEHFVLVGNGVLGPDVEKWLAEHPTVPVQWIPYVENTAEFWSVIDGMVVTSAYEGLPIAMLEALAMGVPVVSTDVGDVALILSDHKGGVIVDKIGDPDAFDARMDGFVKDIAVFREALASESERVLDRFSSKTIAECYHECWQAAISQKEAETDGVPA